MVFSYDYLNRMTGSVFGATTTTYGYDAAGARMFQTVGSTTTAYPNKFYSITSFAQSTTTTLATSTDYVYLGDMLIATVNQALVNGTATGTPTITYIHPDHLGSTAVETDDTGAVTKTLDYYPYGATRVSSGSSLNRRDYIGQFSDDSGLSYLNARYYDAARGQFTSEDPVFWEIGLSKDGKSVLLDPQSLNSYAYANANPLTNKDPNGRCPLCLAGAIGGAFYGVGVQMQYDVASGETTSVPGYVWAGLKGAAQGAAAGAYLTVLPAAAALDYFGYYQTYQNVQDFNDRVLSDNSSNYSAQQQNIAGFSLWQDAVQRAASRGTPLPARLGYDAISSILSSISQILGDYTSPTNSPRVATYPSAQGYSPRTAPVASPTTWGGSSSGLPTSVTQNGTTYVRNSSGLLNFAP